jgi:hypothetical protein
MAEIDADATPPPRLSGLAGLWWFLVTRSRLQARLAIERERNRAYAEHRDRLEGNAELVDHEDGEGRGLWIRKQDAGTAPAGLAFPAGFARARPRYITIVELSYDDEAAAPGELPRDLA